MNSSKIFFGIAFLGVLLLSGFAAAAYYDINVSLTGPVNGNWNATTAANFTFKFITQMANATYCSLYTNATGAWGASSSNNSVMVNNTATNYISNFTIPTNGTIIWNVNCSTLNGTYTNFSASNYTFDFDNSQPIVTITSPASPAYVNRTTTYGYGSGIGNTTIAFTVTGLASSSRVNCSVFMNNSANHTNSTLTANGVTRIEYLQVPNATVAIFNVTCWTLVGNIVGSYATNQSLYLYGSYNNPLINRILTPASNKSWVSSNYLTLNFSTNNSDSIIAAFNASSRLNCSLYLNNTYNATNSSVYPNIHDSSSFVLSTGAGYDGYWQLNFTCADVAGNIGYNDSWLLGLDRSVNYTWNATNYTGYTTSILHSVYWTDVRNLSGFIFASNYTGAWVNDSWVPLYAATSDIVLANYSNVTKTIAGSTGDVLGYYVCANDSLGNWECTPTHSFTVFTHTDLGGGYTPTTTPTATPTPTSTPAPTGAPTYAPTSTPTIAPTGTATATPEATVEQPTITPAAVSETRARAGVSTAQEAIALAKTQGVSAPEAERLLALAQQELNNGQYSLALQNAQLAQNALQQAQAAGGVSGAAGGIDLTIVGVIIIIVLAGAAYFYYTRNKRKGL